MFLIVNTTRKPVSLSDLNVVIEGHQMVDLDKHPKVKINPENSKDLKFATKKGLIRTMKTDRKEKQRAKDIIKQVPEDNNKMLDSIRNIVRDEMKKMTPTEQKEIIRETVVESGDNNQVLDALSKIQELLQNGKINISTPQLIQNNETTVIDLDEEKESQIHAKSIERMSKTLEGEVSYNESSISSDGFSDNLDALEDLMQDDD